MKTSRFFWAATAVFAAGLALDAQQPPQRPLSPAGTAATQVGGQWVKGERGERYENGKWIEVAYNRPLLRTRADMPIFVIRIGIWPAYVGWFLMLFALFVAELTRGVFRDPDLLSHPRTSEEPLDGPRKAVAILTLVGKADGTPGSQWIRNT